jgi:plasmid stability protein
VLELKLMLTDAQTRRIAELAAAHGRSPEEEAVELIRQQIFDNEAQSERTRRASEIAAMAPKDRMQTDSVATVREERDA